VKFESFYREHCIAPSRALLYHVVRCVLMGVIDFFVCIDGVRWSCLHRKRFVGENDQERCCSFPPMRDSTMPATARCVSLLPFSNSAFLLYVVHHSIYLAKNAVSERYFITKYSLLFLKIACVTTLL